MRKTLFAALLLVLAVAFVASAGSIGTPAAAAPEGPGIDGLFVQPEPELCAEAVPVDDIARLFQPTAWHCPWNAPHCRRHDDCDAYCGDPQFGYCFSDGCCGCSG